jgi:hypothetical protein
VIRQILPRLRLHVTIDLHGMEQSTDNDFTAMTLGGFDRDGRLYVVEMKVGRFSPEEVIENIFAPVTATRAALDTMPLRLIGPSAPSGRVWSVVGVQS